MKPSAFGPERELVHAGKRRADTIVRLREVNEGLRTAVRAAAEAGVPETRIAILAGVDRMTVRKWLGK